MIGILVQLAISWLLLWLFEKTGLSVLGFRPTWNRARDFIMFFLVTALLCSSGFFMRMIFASETWQLNPVFNAKLLWEGLWWNIKSVLFEELIFRGALLYILMKRIGWLKAIIVSSIAFGIYHWFSFEILGQPVQMIFVFFITGAMGLVYAYGYVKSQSLYIPIAIHLGWNFTKGFVFSEGSIGNGILIQPQPQPQVQVSYFIFGLISFFPMIGAMLVNYLMLRKRR